MPTSRRTTTTTTRTLQSILHRPRRQAAINNIDGNPVIINTPRPVQAINRTDLHTVMATQLDQTQERPQDPQIETWSSSYGGIIDIARNTQLYTNSPKSNIKRIITCIDCKKKIEKDAIGKKKGYYHQECIKKYKYTCQYCNDVMNEKAPIEKDLHPLCIPCYNKIYILCQGCNIRSHRDMIQFYNIYRTSKTSEIFCATCIKKLLLKRCTSCSYLFVANLIDTCQRCGRLICQRSDCRGSHPDRCRPDSPIMPKSIIGKHLGSIIDINRLVGVEIEIEGADTDILREIQKNASLQHDGSLVDGIEIATHPSSLDALEKIITKTCDNIIVAGGQVSKRCGLHVHIDARDIANDKKKITQIVQTFYAVEDMLYSMLPPSRWNSKYCIPLAHSYLFKDFSLSELIENKWYNNLEYTWEIEEEKFRKYTPSRYAGCNVHSIFHRGTLELRYHSGTIKPTKILFWIYILLHIFEYAINRFDPLLTDKFFGRRTTREKLNLFFEVFRISNPLVANYITSRIEKFNPSFMIPFNKGQTDRINEDVRKDTERETLTKMQEELMKRLKRTAKEDLLLSNLVKKLLDLKKESGFISKIEIQSMIENIRVGQRIIARPNENDEAGEVDF